MMHRKDGRTSNDRIKMLFRTRDWLMLVERGTHAACAAQCALKQSTIQTTIFAITDSR
jgi:hypothetical protein